MSVSAVYFMMVVYLLKYLLSCNHFFKTDRCVHVWIVRNLNVKVAGSDRTCCVENCSLNKTHWTLIFKKNQILPF